MQKILNICKIPKTLKILLWFESIFSSYMWGRQWTRWRTQFTPHWSEFSSSKTLTESFSAFSGPVLPGLIWDFFRTCVAWPDLRLFQDLFCLAWSEGDNQGNGRGARKCGQFHFKPSTVQVRCTWIGFQWASIFNSWTNLRMIDGFQLSNLPSVTI